MTLRTTVLCAAFCTTLAAGTTPTPEERVIQQYVAALDAQAQKTRGASMDVDFDASMGKSKKHGRLHALRRISKVGLIFYEKPQAEGDRTVIKEVIKRYMDGEAEQQKSPSADIAITPNNYKFTARGMREVDGRSLYVFDITPRKKREKLIKGEILIDAQTFLRVQETGNLVKTPDFMIRRASVTRTYDIRDDIAVPRKTQIVSNVRILGPVELNIEFKNFSLDAPTGLAGAEGDNQ